MIATIYAAVPEHVLPFTLTPSALELLKNGEFDVSRPRKESHAWLFHCSMSGTLAANITKST